MRLNLLVIHPALAPYRVDLFNQLSIDYNLELILIKSQPREQDFDKSILRKYAKFDFNEGKSQFIGFFLERPFFKFFHYYFQNFRLPDIVVTYEMDIVTIQIIFLSKIFGFKVYNIEDSNIHMLRDLSFFKFHLKKLLVKNIDRNILTNHLAIKFFRETLKVSAAKIHFFPIISRKPSPSSYSEISITSYSEYSRIYLFVGRIEPEKGILQFVENTFSFFNQNKDSCFLIIGEGSHFNALKKLVRKKCIYHNIVVLGKIERPLLYKYYSISQFFILPSLFEPFGAVIPEALTFGLFCLCSEFAGSSCLINPDNGIIFDPRIGSEALISLRNLHTNFQNVSSDQKNPQNLLPINFDESYSKAWL